MTFWRKRIIHRFRSEFCARNRKKKKQPKNINNINDIKNRPLGFLIYLYFNFNEPKGRGLFYRKRSRLKCTSPQRPGQYSSNAIITFRAKQIHGGLQMRPNQFVSIRMEMLIPNPRRNGFSVQSTHVCSVSFAYTICDPPRKSPVFPFWATVSVNLATNGLPDFFSLQNFSINVLVVCW